MKEQVRNNKFPNILIDVMQGYMDNHLHTFCKKTNH